MTLHRVTSDCAHTRNRCQWGAALSPGRFGASSRPVEPRLAASRSGAATATIEHFSVVVVGSIRIDVAALVEVDASASKTDVVVGDSFDVGVAVTRKTDKQTVEAEFGAVEITDLDGAETLAWLNLLGGGIAGFALEDVPGGKQIAVYEVSPLQGGGG